MSGILGKLTIAGAALGSIGHVISASGPNISQDTIDCSDSDSTFKEKLLGLVDFGEIQVSCNFNKTTYSTLHEAVKTGVNQTDTFTLTYSDLSQHVGTALLTNLTTTGGVGDKRTMDFTLVCSGSWAFTPAP